jgi:hypothetical protein
MSRSDCDACDEYAAKQAKDLRIYREASEAANRIIEKQSREIESLKADLTQSELVIRAKMTCIDEQAQEIRRLEQSIIQKADSEKNLMGQIKKLQAALTKERFWKIWREGRHDDVAKVTELAKKQLRAEMPEEMA